MRNIIIASTVVVVLIAGGVSAYSLLHQKDLTKQQIASHEQTKYVSGGVNYAPPTEADKQMNAEQKKADQAREQIDQQAPATNADITIVDATQYGDTVEVRAYISNLYENGGTCTATFTKTGSATVVSSNQAMTDAQSIQCGALDTPRSKFASAGNWSVVVSYKSNQATGSTSPRTVEIK